jgi:DNA-binding XRE family transcriptional regulator
MIYFIRCTMTARVKIGFAKDPWKRFSKVQSDSPGELQLIGVCAGTEAEERALHQRFASERVRGEWFAESPKLTAHIESLPPMLRPAPKRRRNNTWGDTQLTDKALAQITGISQCQLNRIRNGKSWPSLSAAMRISEATGIPIHTLAKAA